MGEEQVTGQETLNLRGAVDLADPVQQCLTPAKTQLGVQGGEAVVILGLTKGGQLLLSAHCPGGDLQLQGLLAKMQQLLLIQAVQQQLGMVAPGVPGAGESGIG